MWRIERISYIYQYMKRFIMFLVLLSLMATNVLASTVTLSWNRSTSVGVQGYRVYYRDTKTNETLSIDTGNVSQYAVSNLVSRRKYEFWVKAYRNGIESNASNKKAITTK